MKVHNREGQSLDVAFDEIKTRITRLCTPEEVACLDIDKVVIRTINGMYDGITTKELDDLSARVCAEMQGVHYLYDTLAAKIASSNADKGVRRRLAADGRAFTFSGKVAYLNKALPVVCDPGFVRFIEENAEQLDAMMRYERNCTHSYFALRTMERSYLMQVDGDVIESPQDMWMRVAVALQYPRSEAESDGASRTEVLGRIRECYERMSTGDITHATPTLFNAGMRVQQCSSCFLLGTNDSLSGIFKTISDAAQISKWAGGIGVHVSNVRAKGSRILSTNGTSDGIVPMLKVYNETARYCNQAGRRKGSVAVYLEPWHADVWEFVELRRNTGAETERCRDLFLALWVPDEFMRRLEADDMWYLMSPDVCPGLTDAYGDEFAALYNRYVEEKKYMRAVRARALWQHVLNSQLETGTPYVLYKDHVNRKSNQANVGTIRSSNLCAEVTEYSDDNTHAVCNLASIAVNRFWDADQGEIDHARLHEVAKLVTRNLNRVIDITSYPTPEARRSNLSLRPIGVGVQGFGDMYCMAKLAYDDPASRQLDAEVLETIYHGALEASVELAERDGPYERFVGSPFSEGRLQMDMWPAQSLHLSGRYDWSDMRKRVMSRGTRNSLLTALMPTASTSQILGNTESFEPFQSNVFKRSTLAGEFLVVNRHLMRDLMAAGVWSEDLRVKLLACDGSVQRIDEVPQELKHVYRTVWEVTQRSIIDHAVARGPFVDQSQSMNLYMAAPSFQRLSSALIYGWKQGLKTGLYYLRSTAAVEATKFGILSTAPSAASLSSLVARGDDDVQAAPTLACKRSAAATDGVCEMCSA